MVEKTCVDCGDDFEMETDVCQWCQDKRRYAEIAKAAGLTRYPDPSGERYIYTFDGHARKKSESADFFDEMWAAIVRLIECRNKEGEGVTG